MDDVVATFDEARTLQGLNILAPIGERVRAMVLTHHQHVVDAVARALGDEAAVLSLS